MKLRVIMRAIRAHKFGGPEVLQVEETKIPVPNANEVGLRIHGLVPQLPSLSNH